MESREFDLIVFGATGFTGALACEYIARAVATNFKLKVAIAGRNKEKLENARAACATRAAKAKEFAMIVCDCERSSAKAMEDVVKRTSCVLTFAGPYDSAYGKALVKACASAKTDYVDITGEPQFVRECVDELHDDAKKANIAIVQCAGYDSVPWDLGTYACAKAMEARGASLVKATGHAGKSKGGVSGGTIASAANALTSETTKKFKGMGDPLFFARDALKANGMDEKMRWASPQSRAKFDDDTGYWTMPSIMAGINAKVVARSFALDPKRYSPTFTYDESDLCTSKKSALLGTAALGVIGAAFITPPVRWLLRKTVLPAPGQGPSEDVRETGFSNVYVVGKGVDSKTGTDVEPVCAHFEFKNADPGYKGTAALAVEVALCLAIPSERARLPWVGKANGGGCFTPSHAMGDVLIERLNKTENFSITVDELKKTVLRV